MKRCHRHLPFSLTLLRSQHIAGECVCESRFLYMWMSTEPSLLRWETLLKVLRRRKRNVSVVLTAAMTDHLNACLRDFSWSCGFCVLQWNDNKTKENVCIVYVWDVTPQFLGQSSLAWLSLKFTSYFGWHRLPNYWFSKCNVYSEQNLYFYPALSLPSKSTSALTFWVFVCKYLCLCLVAYSTAPAELLHARGGAGVQSQCHVPARCSSG